jgi:hypothetical protein
MNANDVNLANDFARLRDIKAELRRLEESVQRRAERAPTSLEDERAMAEMQSRADAAYTAANRRAPPPLPLERASEYRRRLADGVKAYSPRFREVDLSNVVDAGLNVIEEQIFQDAVVHGRTAGLRAREIKPIQNRTAAGHTTIEFVGGPEAHFVRAFERPARRGAQIAGRVQRDGSLHADGAALAARPPRVPPGDGGSARRILIQFGDGCAPSLAAENPGAVA